MNIPEILAPVGGQEQLSAAVRCGADAVYLGAKGFNARRNAENFDDLAAVVGCCHARGVDVHVTLNTLVFDSEMKELERTLDEVAASGADAVIVQDLAVMRLVKERYPTLKLHASTQCAVHNTDGVKLFEDYGVDRVVLARELSIKEIEKIRAATSVELETFVHGALCMCLSGACYLSGMLGGRSGNRGLCAQPCRLDFKGANGGYALSLKDMSHLAHVRELAEAGVASLKIEGRMKRPEYVAAAVTAARQAAMGEKYDEETLRAVFSRSGFTDGYATGERRNMFGHREKEDVTSAEGVLGALRRLYDKEAPRVKVDFNLAIGENSSLTASALGKSVTVTGEGGIEALSRPTDAALAEKNLSKLGGTQFYLGSVELSNPAKLMLPPSVINALRRSAVERLNGELSTVVPHSEHEWNFDIPVAKAPEKPEFWAKFEKKSQLFEGADRYILPIGEIDGALIEKYGSLLTAALPDLDFPETEDKTRASLSELGRLGLSSVYAPNCGGIELAKSLGLSVFGAPELNIVSTAALEEYRALGLEAATVSWETRMSRVSALGGTLPRGIVAYGYLPVMRFRNCPNRRNGQCGDCNGYPHLTDRKGAKFQIICHNRRDQTLLNSVPLHIGGKGRAECDYYLCLFTVESAAECRKIFDEIKLDRPSEKPRTGGLYYRELL
jgi:putative protease